MGQIPIGRRFDLDWIRILAILTVFVAHCGRFFDSTPWHVKNGTTYPGMDLFAGVIVTWLMPLIFVISGAAIVYSLRKGPIQYIKDKTMRLLVPLVFGILTHVMVGVYLERVTQGYFRGTLVDFVPHYFDGLLFFGGNFAWMGLHLWYLEVLFVYSVVCLPLFMWLAGPARPLLTRLSNLLATRMGLYLLALPGTLLIPFLNPANLFAGDRGWGGWNLPVYVFFLLGGFIIASSEAIQERIKRQRWMSLAVGMLLLAAVGALTAGGEPRFGTLDYALATTLHSLASWCLVLALLGLGMHYLNAGKAWLRYANEAVLPFYILHQTVILCIGYYVVRWHIPDLLKYGAILVSSFVVTMAVYEFLVRRVNVMRFVFGMKPLPPRIAAGSTGEPAASLQT